jgi:hypothetical protein
MSSYPVRLTTLFFGSTNTCHVARQSAHVTGVPSLQTAFGLYWNETVSGFLFTSLGGPVKSLVCHSAFTSRIWPPYQMLLSTRLVAKRLLSTQLARRLGGSWSWMKTTVPA